VLDNGAGIPQETLKTLFKPFARGNTHADGTGLGLYICRDLIANMGGELRYLDNPEGGSCFEIDLTVDLADKLAKEVTNDEVPLLAGKRILLVEDNKTLQLLTEKLLTKQGARVEVADQGLDGLVKYQAGQFDLILSDIFMPEMNGYEFVSELRKRDCRLPIIGLTAATIGEETEQMLAAGADVVMSKPMNITEVCKWLANFSR
jgi:CheY-like chemotaxis protein